MNTTPTFSQTFDIPVHEMFEDKAMGFAYAVAKHAAGDGYHVIVRFDNGFGCSIVNSPTLHLFEYYCEVAMIKFTGPGIWDWNLTYDTQFTDDVLVFGSYDEFKTWFFEAAVWGHGAPEDVAFSPPARSLPDYKGWEARVQHEVDHEDGVYPRT